MLIHPAIMEWGVLQVSWAHHIDGRWTDHEMARKLKLIVGEKKKKIKKKREKEAKAQHARSGEVASAKDPLTDAQKAAAEAALVKESVQELEREEEEDIDGGFAFASK